MGEITTVEFGATVFSFQLTVFMTVNFCRKEEVAYHILITRGLESIPKGKDYCQSLQSQSHLLKEDYYVQETVFFGFICIGS